MFPIWRELNYLRPLPLPFLVRRVFPPLVFGGLAFGVPDDDLGGFVVEGLGLFPPTGACSSNTGPGLVGSGCAGADENIFPICV